jgi:hypothetical protein
MLFIEHIHRERAVVSISGCLHDAEFPAQISTQGPLMRAIGVNFGRCLSHIEEYISCAPY